MTDPQTEPTDGPQGPAQWVPKGALSRFLVQGAAWAFVAQLLAIVAGIASQVFLARLLTPDALGIFFLTQSVVLMAANIGEFGLSRPIARMISADVGSGRVGSALRALRSAVAISCISGFVVIVFFAGGLGRWLALRVFDSSLMANSVGLVSLWIAGRIVLSIGSAVLQGLHRVGLSALLGGSISGTVLAVVCGGATLGRDACRIRHDHRDLNRSNRRECCRRRIDCKGPLLWGSCWGAA